MKFLISQQPDFSEFMSLPGIFVAVSARKDGNMKVFSSSGIDPAAVINRCRYFKQIGISEQDTVSVNASHSDVVRIVTGSDTGITFQDTDGLITSRRNVFLAITIADCLPIILFEPEKRLLGLVHSGWKGLDIEIIKEAIDKMKDTFGADPGKILAGIGPGIGPCHFEVREDLLKRFDSYPAAIQKRGKKFFMDLKLIAKMQMETAGIKPENIYISPDCTYCMSDKYFSFRKDRIKPVKAMLCIAAMFKK